MGENDIDYEDLIEIVEDCCSAPIRALLKREDEKFVTESSYDHAAFVETTSRAIAEKLEHLPVRGFSVLCEHEESLHQHNAVAVVRGGKEYVY
jgi:GTP cyclohydrolase I